MRRRLFAAILMAAACGSDPAGVTEDPGHDGAWETASPASQNFDVQALNAALAHARTMPELLSLLVVRNGKLVVEEYFNGNRADSLNDVRSVTKSVVSLLAGIAVQRGELRPDTRIGDHLDRWAADMDETERATTVQHLLTMTGGWSWDENTVAEYNNWVVSPDPVAYVLRRPRAALPGTTFRYNTATVHLLATVLEDATGRTLQAYAQEHLFGPLGITRARWEEFADGRANGGAGLDLRPADLARLGQLVLRNGVAGDTRILEPEWLAHATAPAFPYWQAAAPLGQQSYGWLWWLSGSPGPASIFAWGHGGQFIWIVPSLDLVVVVTHDWRSSPVPANQLQRNGFELIVQRVVPAAR